MLQNATVGGLTELLQMLIPLLNIFKFATNLFMWNSLKLKLLTIQKFISPLMYRWRALHVRAYFFCICKVYSRHCYTHLAHIKVSGICSILVIIIFFTKLIVVCCWNIGRLCLSNCFLLYFSVQVNKDITELEWSWRTSTLILDFYQLTS